MKGRLLTAFAVAAAVAIPATGASAGSPKQDQVDGGGENGSVVTNHFAISAHANADDTDAHGNGHFIDTNDPPQERFNGEVVCMRVSGKDATVVIRYTHTKNQPAQFDGDLMRLEDNGNPQGGQSPDFITNARLTAAQVDAFAANGCPTPTFPGGNPLKSGNININDAP